jgi:class 3 adenylate cyclase
MRLRRTWTWEFALARERLWAFLGDTDWVNEAAGLPRIRARYEPLPEGGARRIAWFKNGPVTVEWEELPTMWQAPEFHQVERRYTRGPLRRFSSRTTLEEIDAHHTRVRVDLELDAASPLLAPLLPFLAEHGRRGADRAFVKAAKLSAQEQTPASDAQRALDEFLAKAEDREVRRMRPNELAQRWQLPRREVLRAFLEATREGKLNLRWRVICPGCRGPSAGIETLENVQGVNHCPSCNINFDATFDRSVEVTFDARPLRPNLQEEALFCIASPQRSPHVHLQRSVAPGGKEFAKLELGSGTYDVNAVGIRAVPFIVSREGSAACALPVCVSHDEVEVPHEIAGRSIDVSLENTGERDTLIRIEDGRWPGTIVTAAQVTALQEFRDLFSSEVLAPGLELGIETIAVLFTDLVGSTVMYSRTGDAPAFRIVNDHFGLIREIVARYEGAIVKTIGDAVMAVFVNPANCLRASIELDRKVQGVTWDGMPLRLRAGMHVGPCIAMRANERIDYFGTTVNLAARLEALAEPGEVTLAKSDAQRADIAPLLAASGLRTTDEFFPLKGFEQPIAVVRVQAHQSVP